MKKKAAALAALGLAISLGTLGCSSDADNDSTLPGDTTSDLGGGISPTPMESPLGSPLGSPSPMTSSSAG